jgi:dihydroflavonol-4-reductase
MEAALANGVGRFIFTSTMGTLGRNPDGPVTEGIEFNWMDKAPPYIRSRRLAEDEFNRYCREKKLPGVALCISTTYGPQDYQPTPQGQMLWDTSQGRTRVVWEASQPIVDIRDAAEALLLAEKHGRIGERYIISSEYVSYRRFFGMIAERGGHAPPIVLPLSVAYAAAWLGESLLKLLRRRDYFVSRDAVFLSIAFGEMDSSKARRELHWKTRPTSQTIQDSIEWFSERNKIASIGAGAPSYFGRTEKLS